MQFLTFPNNICHIFSKIVNFHSFLAVPIGRSPHEAMFGGKLKVGHATMILGEVEEQEEELDHDQKLQKKPKNSCKPQTRTRTLFTNSQQSFEHF